MINGTPFGGSTPLIVDKLLGVSFKTVKEVQENLDIIQDAANLLAELEYITANITGIQGVKGDQGEPGIGIKGDTGAPGQSIKGDKGDPGEPGVVPNLEAINTAIAALNLLISDETTARLAAVNTVNTASIAGDTALATSISTVVASVGAANSRITNEQIARASGDSALASSIGVVSTSLNGMTASVTTLSQSINGVRALYGVTLDVNGFITGFKQNNNGQTGSFDILANTFRVATPGRVPVTVFGVDANGVYITGNVRIDGDLLITGSVKTQAMPQNAISTSAYYRTSYAGQMNLFPTNQWTDFNTEQSGGSLGSIGGSGGGTGGFGQNNVNEV